MSNSDEQRQSENELDAEDYEIELFSLIQQYFNKHGELRKENLPEFLEFLNLQDQNQGKEQLDNFWNMLSQNGELDVLDLEKTKEGFLKVFNEDEEKASTIRTSLRNTILQGNEADKPLTEDEITQDHTLTVVKELEASEIDRKLEEMDPEILRGMLNAFYLLDVFNNEVIKLTQIELLGITYSFLRFTPGDMIEFIQLLFGVYDEGSKTLKVKKDRFKIVCSKISEIVEQYKNSILDLHSSMKGKELYGEDENIYYSGIPNAYEELIEDLTSIEQELEAYSKVLKAQNRYSSYFAQEMLFLAVCLQTKNGTLKSFFKKYQTQLSELTEEYKLLNQKFMDSQANENDNEQMQRLMDEITLINDEKEQKGMQIDKLKGDIVLKEEEIQELSSTINQTKLFSEEQQKEIIKLKNEVIQLKKNYDLGVTEVLNKIKLDEENNKKLAQAKISVFNEAIKFDEKAPGAMETHKKLNKLPYENLLSYSTKLDLDNQELNNKYNTMMEKYKDLERRFEIKEKKCTEVQNENSKLKSENAALQNQVEDLSNECEMNNLYKPSSGLNLGSRVSRVSRVSKVCYGTRVTNGGTGVTFNPIKEEEEEEPKSSIKKISVLEETESEREIHTSQHTEETTETKTEQLTKNYVSGSTLQSNFSNTKGENKNEVKGSSTQKIISKNKNMNENTDENTNEVQDEFEKDDSDGEIELTQGEGGHFEQMKVGKTKIVSSTRAAKESSSKVSTDKKKETVLDKFKKNRFYKPFKPKASKDIIIGDSEQGFGDEKSADKGVKNLTKKEIIEGLDTGDTRDTKIREIYQEIGKRNLSKKVEEDVKSAFEKAKIDSRKRKPYSNRKPNKENTLFSACEEVPRSDTTPSVPLSSAKTVNVSSFNDGLDEMFSNPEEHQKEYITEKKPKKEEEKEEGRKSVDFLSFKTNTAINKILDSTNQSFSCFDMFSDVIYMVDGATKKKTKHNLLITASFIYIIDIDDNSKYEQFSKTQLQKIIISQMNPNLLVLEFTGRPSLILESFRRIILLRYFKNHLAKEVKTSFKFSDVMQVRAIGRNGREMKIEFDSRAIPITPNFEDCKKVGYLWKFAITVGLKTFKERLCVLTDCGLLYFDDPPVQPRKLITLVNCEIQYADEKYKRPNTFEIIGPNGSKDVFSANSIYDMQNWIKCLTEVSTDYKLNLSQIDKKYN